MSGCAEPLDVPLVKLCVRIAQIGCATSMVKTTVSLIVTDPCDPPTVETDDGPVLVAPYTQTFWPGQCIALPATSGTTPGQYLSGSGIYQITVCDAETGSTLFGPANVDVPEDAITDDPEACLDITTLLAAC